ncbi:MAG: agmatinase family protein [Betaproteobacteria bacterium]
MNTVTDTTMWEGSLHAGSIGSFLNKPRVACKADALRAAGATVAFLGFPWDGTCISRTGTNMGPKGLREASEQFLTFNANTGMDLEQAFTFVDAGDVAIVPGNSVATQQRAEDRVAEILAADAIPVIGGGDHSITIGPARAFARKYRRCGMIHFDTHLDTAQDVGGETLNHCCPIARAVDAGFRPGNIVTIGPSGWMNPRSELAYVRDKGINLFTLEDVWELGVPEVAARAVALASKDVDAVYLTIDIDVLDASQAPGTGVPTPCGMTARELLGIITRLKGAPIRAIDLAEVSPPWDPSGITSRLGMRILLDALAAAAASR